MIEKSVSLDRFLPESPRWLLSKGRIEECSSVLHSIAERNKRVDPPELVKVLCELKKEERRAEPVGIGALFSKPSLRKRIFIVALKTLVELYLVAEWIEGNKGEISSYIPLSSSVKYSLYLIKILILK